jgi:hypothetical protein
MLRMGMKTGLIDLKKEPILGEENPWPRPMPLPCEPVKDAEISPLQHSLRPFLEFGRSHENSLLND